MFYKYYMDMKRDKLEASDTASEYLEKFIEVFTSMLIYKNVPENFDIRLFNAAEVAKMVNGHCVIVDINGKPVALPGNYAGAPDAYGFGDIYIAATKNGEVFEIPTSEAMIFRNNNLYESDIESAIRYAKLLTEIDISINTLVRYSRYVPSATVKDAKVKRALEEALNRVADGLPTFIQKSETVLLSEAFNGESSDFEKLDLLDPSLSDKIQYLSKLHDDILRRCYTFIGHALSGSEKLAQQTVDEVTSHDTISMIYPLNRLKCAIEDIEAFNKKYNTNIEVDFSDAWKIALGRISEGDDIEEPSTDMLEDNDSMKEDGEDESE